MTRALTNVEQDALRVSLGRLLLDEARKAGGVIGGRNKRLIPTMPKDSDDPTDLVTGMQSGWKWRS